MGKGAGFWKKIKDVAKKIGGTVAKVVSWGNENIFKPIKPLLQTAVGIVDKTGIGSTVLNIAGQAADWVSDQYQKQTGYTPNNTAGQFVSAATDIAMDTQRYGNDKQYNNFADYANRIVQPFNQISRNNSNQINISRGDELTPIKLDPNTNYKPSSGIVYTNVGPRGTGYDNRMEKAAREFRKKRTNK